MFTGIIQHRGAVLAASDQAGGRRLAIDITGWAHLPEVGDSIAVNGCCLTVAAPISVEDSGDPDDEFHSTRRSCEFDVVHETLRSTTLGTFQPGTPVNLEHAVKAGATMDGHFVQGHIVGTGTVARAIDVGTEPRLYIATNSALMKAIIPRGSVAVDGVSLTVAAVHDAGFEVALIPTTLTLTTLGSLQEGDAVNIETDMLARAVVHLLGEMGLPANSFGQPD